MIKTNELQLSNDLTTITTEIKSYENIAGQSIFEIGRRLKWVKENDLAHGEFETWLSEIDMRPRQAQRFIKVATEFPKTSPVSHLGMSVLYEIATLPEEEKQKQIERVESGEKVSRREIEEIKRQLKAKEEIIADQENQLEENRKAQLELNSQLSKRPREVVTKTVEVEKAVTPPDYQDLKQQVADHQTQTAKLENDLARLKQERDEANQALLLEQGKVEDRDEKLKEAFDVNAYTEIRHGDYQEAMNFARQLSYRSLPKQTKRITDAQLTALNAWEKRHGLKLTEPED